MFREREASSVCVLRVVLGGRRALRQPLAYRAVCFGQLNRCVGLLGTGAVSRIYAQLRPLRNVRALLPPSRSRRCRAPQNSVKSAAARDAPREGCGGGADACLDWWVRFCSGKTRGHLLASVLLAASTAR